jgi:hypothetical protein
MLITGLSVAAGLLVLVLLFKPIFGGLDGFMECVRFWFTPDVFSLFRGEWGEDFWAEMKLGIWLGLGAASGYAAKIGLEKLLSQ